MSPWKQSLVPKSESPLAIAAALSYEIKSLRKSKIPGCIYMTTGMGVKNTRGSLLSSLSNENVKVLLFVGLAGALSPKLEIGDIVVVRNLMNSEIFYPSSTLISIAEKVKIKGSPVKLGSVVTVPTIVSSVKARQDLVGSLPLNQNEIIDMESLAVNEVCSQFKIPFIIVRAVSDLSGEEFPIDFNKCLNLKGEISISKILLSLTKKPSAVPGMLKLQKRSQLCMRQLTLFLKQFIKNLPS